MHLRPGSDIRLVRLPSRRTALECAQATEVPGRAVGSDGIRIGGHAGRDREHEIVRCVVRKSLQLIETVG